MKKINKNKFEKNSVTNKITSDRVGVVLFFLSFLLIFFLFSEANFVRADDEKKIENDIEELAEEKEDLEKDVKKVETEIQQVNNQIHQTQTVIQKTAQVVEELEGEIESREEMIEKKEKSIAFKKKVLEEYIRLFRRNVMELGLATFSLKKDLGKYLRETEKFEDFQSKIKDALEVIKEEKLAIENEKSEIESKKEEKDEALKIQEQQRQNLVYQERQKQSILSNTKASIAEIDKKMSELKTSLNRILGKSYDTGEIKDAIKFANKQTGVSKGFLFGMLSFESGGNPLAGGCTYKNSGMSDDRKRYFKDICEELDYDYKKMPVSCPQPGNYSGSGGAMGAAQFMSNTWWGHKNEIANLTGHNPPDPWSLTDGVMAMAIKLAKDGANNSGDVRIVNPCNRDEKIKVDWEDWAALKYLGFSCYGLTYYAPGIQNLKDGYDDL